MITYSALISACAKGKQPERALEVFKAMQQQGIMPHVITYRTLISAGEASKQQGMVPHVISHNALISACEQGKEPTQAPHVFQSLLQQEAL